LTTSNNNKKTYMKKMTLAVLSGLLYLSANAQELETDTAEIESIDEIGKAAD
jgi:hypothetical protein